MTSFDASLDPQRTEPALTEREMAVRDVFVNEYLKDFDAFRACIRMGFLHAFAVDQAQAFLQDGYVLRKIAFLTRENCEPSQEDRAAMLANLRWLAHNGSPASRTAATQRYMEAQGYVKADDGSDDKIAMLAEALKGFAETAPA